MKTQHAPGPFPLTVEKVPNEGQHKYLVVTNQGNHFAATYDPQAARLIAAAPELLAALEALLGYDSLGAYERANVRKQARAAIAKAKGE